MRPNILLLTTDQHRFDFIEGGAGPPLRLPAMGRLAREGTTLINSYSVCPICSPARISWNHGIYPSQISRHSHAALSGFVPPFLPAFPSALQDAGYRTALIGKLHYRPPGCSDVLWESADVVRRVCGYDEVFEVSGKSLACFQRCEYTRHLESLGLLETYLADVRSRIPEDVVRREPYRPTPIPAEHCMDAFIGRHVREYLGKVDGARPFFLHASFCNPHFPYDPPEPYFARYRPEEMPPPLGVQDPEHIRYWREIRAAYCGLLAQLDDEIGGVLGVLEGRGLLENTAIFFLTDHGDLLGDEHYEFSKCRPEDASSRTPLTVRFPRKVAAGRELPGPFESVDLAASILEAAGLGNEPGKYLPASPGISAWRYLTGESGAHREWAYSEFGENPWYHEWRMVVSEDWKYIFDAVEGDKLFDRRSDLRELRNLADDPSHQCVLSEMRRRLIRSMTRASMPPIPSFYPDAER